MVYIIVLIALFLFFAIRLSKIEYISKFVLYAFVGYWFVSLIISCVNPYGYFPIKNYTYVLLLIGIISFVIGMLSVSNKNALKARTIIKGFDSSGSFDKLVSNKIVLIVYLVISLYCIPMVVNTVAMAAVSGGVAMTDDKMEIVFLNNAFNSLLFQYVMYPLLHLDYALLAYMIIKRNTNFFAWVIFTSYLLEFMLMAGGRSILFIAMLYIVVIYFCITPVKLIKNFSIKRIIGLSLLLIVLMYSVSIMTDYRTSGILFSNNTEKNVLDETTERVVTYSILPFGLFNDALQNGLCEKYQYTYGRATFAGVDVLVKGLAKRFGVPYNTTMDIVIDVQNNYVQIGPDNYYNYAYTGLFYHYIDFGIIGLFIFPFIFGLLFRKIIINYCRDPNIGWLLLICLTFFLALHSVFTCYFIKPWVVPYIIILLFVARKKKSQRLRNMLNNM